MNVKRVSKSWLRAGAFAALFGLGAVHLLSSDRAHASSADEIENGSELKQPEFDAALEHIFEGEGGDHGLGLSRSWPRVSVPALTNEQLKQVITGNTLRRNENFAVYFAPNGAVEGWQGDWNEVAAAKCPKNEVPGDEFFLASNGKCWERTMLELTGSWQITGNQFCNQLDWETGTWDRCFHVYMLLDQFGFFDVETGKMDGRGQLLAKGKVMDVIK